MKQLVRIRRPTSYIRVLLAVLMVSALAAAEGRLVRAGNLIYAGDQTSVCFSDRFLTTVETESGINTEKRMHAVHLSQADELMATPFVIMNGQNAFTLQEGERANLKKYLEGGGFLLASAGCSSEQWSTSLLTELKAMFGADCLTTLPDSHAVFRTLFDLKPPLQLSHGGTAVFQGLILDGRLACLFSKEGLNDTAHTTGCCCCGGNEVKPAEEMVANCLVYALVE